ncbi:unnamed protein product [Coregonus sp. 'balchen']|nr:unnamed protein product [Coregonus sp. 'balchen']
MCSQSVPWSPDWDWREWAMGQTEAGRGGLKAERYNVSLGEGRMEKRVEEEEEEEERSVYLHTESDHEILKNLSVIRKETGELSVALVLMPEGVLRRILTRMSSSRSCYRVLDHSLGLNVLVHLVQPETEPTEPGPLDCREEQYPCTRLYSIHKPCKQCLNSLCFYSLQRVYVINKEVCVRTVCAHEELLRADMCRDQFSRCGVAAVSGQCGSLGSSCGKSCGGC